MSLPIANLGYMPNMSTPSGGGHYVKPNPWQDLALSVLSSVAQQGVKNELSPDYTEQAQREGLQVDPNAAKATFIQRFLQGPTTSQDQLGQLRQQSNQQQLEGTRQVGETKRSKDTQAFTAGENTKNRATTVSEGDKNRAHATLMQGTELNAANTRQGAGFLHDEGMANINNASAFERLNAEITAQERQLGRKLTAEEQNVVTRGFIDNVGNIVTKQNPMAPLLNDTLHKQGLPSMPTTDEQINAYAAALKKMGFNIIPPQSTVPPIPMIQP